MTPIIYKGQKVAFSSRNLPIQYTYQVTTEHQVIVKRSNKLGIPNGICKKFQKACNDPNVPSFAGLNKVRVKSKNIFYFTDVLSIGGSRTATFCVQPGANKSSYVPSCSPFIPLDSF